MAITLTTTIGGSTSNSYVERAETDTYSEYTAYATAWAAKSNTEKDTLIARACKLLDERFAFLGVRVSSAQALAWPRAYVVDDAGEYYSTLVIPRVVKDAQALIACFLAAQVADAFAPNSTAGFESITADVIELVFRDGGASAGAIFLDEIVLPLLQTGNVVASAGRLVR